MEKSRLLLSLAPTTLLAPPIQANINHTSNPQSPITCSFTAPSPTQSESPQLLACVAYAGMRIWSNIMGKNTTVTSYAATRINAKDISVRDVLNKVRIDRQQNGTTYVRSGRYEVAIATSSGNIKTAVIL